MNAIHLPRLFASHIPGTEWQIIAEEIYGSIINENEIKSTNSPLKKIIELIDAPFNDFRFQHAVRTVPFLLAIFYSRKEIRCYSPHLNQELFILNAIGNNPDAFEMTGEEWQDYQQHVTLVQEMNTGSFPSDYEVLTYQHKLPNFLEDKEYQEVINEMRQDTQALLKRIHQYKPSLFERLTDTALSLTAEFTLIRNHLLKFIAILPSIEHDNQGKEVKRLFIETLRRLRNDSEKIKTSVNQSLRHEALPNHLMVLFSFIHFIARITPLSILASRLRKVIRSMARRFIAGEKIDLAVDSIQQLKATQRDVTLDQLGELVVSEKEADNYMEGVLQLIKGFSLHYSKGEVNKSGIYRANVSVKVSALCSQFKPEDFDYTYGKVAPRLRKILLEAYQNKVFINIDAESYHHRDVIFRVYREVILEDERLKTYKGTGVVLQAYLKDAYEHFLEILSFAREKGTTVPVRLVKGAYWDAETIEADAHGFPAPEFLNKEETDLYFRVMLFKILENYPHLQLEIASHNFQDHVFAEKLREMKFKDTPPIEHQCLHMTYEALSTAMTGMGWVVRNYIPIGSLLVGMAYLVRRIMENSSQVGVLTIMRSHKETLSLIDPVDKLKRMKKDEKLSLAPSQVNLSENFRNVPAIRLFLYPERIHVNEALSVLKQDFGETYPNLTAHLNGDTEHVISSSDPGLVVGKIKFATLKDTEEIIKKAHDHYQAGSWANNSWQERCSVMVNVANILLSKRLYLASLIVYEAGKTISEAIADVDEAIDFVNFYLREEKRLVQNSHHLLNRGVVAVISPWNFPIAISCGMIAAPLVAGNTVILKSAESTPLIAQCLVDIFYEAGLEIGTLTHCPGTGEDVGQALVDSEQIAQVVFTGSKEVGTMISSHAGRRLYHNPLHQIDYPAKPETEMGGKNAIIVAENAELDETMAGIIYSAFAHAGQKCSAASRIIVSNKIKDKLIERLKEAVRDVEVGPAYEYKTLINPLITGGEKERLMKQTSEAEKEAKRSGGRVIIDRSNEQFEGFCVGPALYEVPPEYALNPETFCHRELFAPVIHVTGFDTLKEAVEIFNATDYALTGGIYSQSQDDIDFCTARMEAGNIYVNRKITGSRVFIEPFGGFKMSGTGPKAGSKQYVRSFHIEKPSFPEMDCEGDKYFLENIGAHDLELAGKSNLGFEQRVQLFKDAMSLLINDLRTEGNHRYDHYKVVNLMFQLSDWIDKNLYDFIYAPHPNRKIPGQISFADYRLIKEKSVVITCNRTPHATTMLYVLSGIALGSGMNIITTTKEAFSFWENLQSLNSDNILIKKMSTRYISRLFQQNPYISNVISDLPANKEDDLLKLIFAGNQNAKRLIQLLSSLDSPSCEKFEKYLLKFINIRSFAINTVRFGAPLEIEK